MSRIDQNITQDNHKTDKHFSWNDCDDELKKRIEKNNFVKNIRNQLAKKSFVTKFRLGQKRQS